MKDRTYIQLYKLRAKHAGTKYRLPFPDLKCPPSPCTNGFGPTPKHVPPKMKGNLIVDSLHKQGMMVLSRDELPWAGGRKP
jgi:hypothetical protein